MLFSALLAFATAGCHRVAQPEVVVYTALDRLFSEPILTAFERETGIKVLAKYDTEATKTVGLVNALRAEKDRPRCDVFWNNEIVNTVRLQSEGLLTSWTSPAVTAFPAIFRDPNGTWCGFAARARVLLVNTNLVAPDQRPRSILDLADPRWRGRTGLAKPLFGSTATHVAALFAALGTDHARSFLASLKANGVQIQSGNRAVAMNVANGTLAFGLTDTDDAMEEVQAGSPVTIVYPDAEPNALGVLFIPNTLAIVKGGPHPDAARRLADYLLSPTVETTLARSESAQIPLNPAVTVGARVKTPADVHAMPVDWAAAARAFDTAASSVEELLLR